MKIKPILFNTEMVQAILAGRKTQTRRVCKGQGECSPVQCGYHPPYKPGDILWVRETWQNVYTMDDNDQPLEETGRYIYYADSPMPFDYWVDTDTGAHKEQMPWKPSIHMPKQAARIFLRVKDVRAQRLQDMDEDDAIAEGFEDSPAGTDSPLLRFTELWDKTIKRDDLREFGYHANPWVWVITFERCEKPERFAEK